MCALRGWGRTLAPQLPLSQHDRPPAEPHAARTPPRVGEGARGHGSRERDQSGSTTGTLLFSNVERGSSYRLGAISHHLWATHSGAMLVEDTPRTAWGSKRCQWLTGAYVY